MKSIMLTPAAFALAILGLSIPSPIVSSQTFAGRMDGKPSCGQMNCMQDRYLAAKRKESQTKKPTK